MTFSLKLPLLRCLSHARSGRPEIDSLQFAASAACPNMEILSITRESRGYLVKQPRKHFDSEWDSYFSNIAKGKYSIDRLKINIVH